jgi:hypothetical protein
MTTIAAMRTRVRTRLEETTAAVWTDAEVDEGITGALEAYSWLFPNETTSSVVVADGATSAALPAGAIEVRRVILASGEVLPKRGAPQRRTADEEPAWEVFAGTMYFARPLDAQILLLWHTSSLTLADLPPADEGLVVLGGVVQALEARAVQDFKRGGPVENAGYDGVLRRARAGFERELERRRRRVRSTLASAP